MDENDILKHVGVLGMKWGVRRGSKRTPSSQHIRTAALKKKKAFELTNEELKEVTERLNLERQYSALNPSTISRGKKAIGSLLGKPLSSLASNVVKEHGKDIFVGALRLGVEVAKKKSKKG